jgi:sugar lactone lactonase YvrE
MADELTGMLWGEGPRFHDGALWLSDTQGSRLWTNASGTWRATEVESPSNGLWFLPDGRLVGAMIRERRVGQWDGSRWQTYADLAPMQVGPLGDMIGDSKGNLYLDDVAFNSHLGEASRPGRVLLVRPDRRVEVAAEGVEFPNGLAFLDGGRTLVVAETNAKRLTAFDVAADGHLSGRRLYADITALAGPDARPDGIWHAAEGIWVATLEGCAVVRVRDGQLLARVDTAPRLPIACCVRDDGALLVTVADTHGQPLADALKARTLVTSAMLVTPG